MQQVIDFLTALSANNNRPWFLAHKADYLEAKSRFDAMAVRLVDAIGRYDATVRGLQLPQVTYRIYRDARFTTDKRPYKTHMGVYVCRGGKKSDYSGYYFHVAPEGCDTYGMGGCCLAAGDYQCDKRVLQILREDIVNGEGDFQRIIDAAHPFTLNPSDCLKKVPRGFDPALACAPLLRHRVFCLIQPLPVSFVTASDVAERVAEAFRPAKPFLDYLNRAVDYVHDELGV